MSRAFAGMGHSVCLTGLGPSVAPVDGIQVRLLHWPWARFRIDLLKWGLRRQMAGFKPDLVFTRNILLAHVAAEAGKAVILELHGLPVASSYTARTLGHLLTHPQLKRVITISQGLADDLRDAYPSGSLDVVVAHDAADAGPSPTPAPVERSLVRVGYFGNLYKGKGMEMISALSERLPNLQFDVYGGTEEDISYWTQKTDGRVNLTLHGHIPHDQVAARMEQADILLAPYAGQVSHSGQGDISRWMSPLKLFEYMAAGRAIVTTDLPVLREVVRDQETACLCPPDDPAAWATTLQRLASDPVKRRELGQAARELLEHEYTWDKRAEKVLAGVQVSG